MKIKQRNIVDHEAESAYVLRRVELNHRELSEGQSPWSIRQTAVYHKLHSARNPTESTTNNEEVSKLRWQSTFLFLAPSDNFQQQLGEYLMLNVPSGDVSPWELHRQIIADSLENWLDYMAHLEEEMRKEVRDS